MLHALLARWLQKISTINPSPYPLWPDVSRLPPSGVNPCTASASVVIRPSPSSPQPAGIGIPARRATSILPNATVAVDISRQNGNPPVGTANASGFVPSIGSLLNVGTTSADEFVIAIPP